MRRNTAETDDDLIHEACAVAWLALVRRTDVTLDRRGYAWLVIIATYEARHICRQARATQKVDPAPDWVAQIDELRDPCAYDHDPLEHALDAELHAERCVLLQRTQTPGEARHAAESRGLHYAEIATERPVRARPSTAALPRVARASAVSCERGRTFACAPPRGMGIVMVKYNGHIVGFYTARRAHLVDDLDAEIDGERIGPFLLAMCLYAVEVQRHPGFPRYRELDARRFAQAMLIPGEVLEHLRTSNSPPSAAGLVCPPANSAPRSRTGVRPTIALPCLVGGRFDVVEEHAGQSDRSSSRRSCAAPAQSGAMPRAVSCWPARDLGGRVAAKAQSAQMPYRREALPLVAPRRRHARVRWVRASMRPSTAADRVRRRRELCNRRPRRPSLHLRGQPARHAHARRNLSHGVRADAAPTSGPWVADECHRLGASWLLCRMHSTALTATPGALE